jgi:hypothetical protein
MPDAMTEARSGFKSERWPFAVPRLLWWIALLTMLLGILRIAATYNVFSATYDEPAHIAAGMQLLDRHEFTYEPLHPPLARIAAALGPYLAGYRSQGGGDMWIEGRRIFYGRSGHPDAELLTLARLGVLPFFLLSLALTWRWTARRVGSGAAALAVILLGNLPVFLAHNGLATTDAVFAATFLLAFFAFLGWLGRPSPVRGLGLGAAVALAVAAKLSALLFLPAACGAVLAHRWICERKIWRPTKLVASWHGVLAPAAAFLLTIWVVYGCKADPFYGIASLARGVGELAAFAEEGEFSYFFGQISEHGSWAFFPVLILVKTPIAFLIAFGIGAATLFRSDRRDWRRMAPLLSAAAIVAAVLPSTINIGLRHILPIFPLMAIVAGMGLAPLVAAPLALQRAALAGLLLAWQVAETAAAAPDYLAYFNQFAFGQPQRIVVGSDLDWGQDVRRLLAALKERGVSRVHLALHTSADLRKHDFPPFETLYPGEPTTGWIAISEQVRAFYCAGYRWLDPYKPVARIGRSILLYHVPGPPAEPGAPDLLRRFNWAAPQPCSPTSS